MKRHRLAFHHFLFVLFLCTATLWWQCGAESGLRIRTATCEYLKNPVGIDVSRPRFSWTFSATGRGQKQTAYQLLVARDPELLRKNRADQWDSGKIDSDQSTHVRYAGKPLRSHETYYWQVRAWDGQSRPSAFSRVQRFTTAFLTPDQWQAQWIGRPGGKDPVNEQGFYNQPLAVNEEGDSIRYNPRSLLLRKSFLLQRPVKQALLYVSGLGYYELNVNGEKIGDQVLAPAKTFYKKVVLYDAYDVSAQIRPGANALALMLGNGWFNPLPKWWSWRMQWYGAKRALLQLVIVFQDGGTQVLCSDSSWKTADGPVLSSCIYDGEIYDANQEIPGWTAADFDDRSWMPAAVLAPPGGRLVASLLPPIRITEKLQPLRISQPQPGIQVVDMGQNFAGWLRIRFKGSKDQKVTIRYAERVSANGRIDPRSNNLAAATDVYIMKGAEEEVYQPRFTYHGFRYAEISGYSAELTKEQVEGHVVHSSVEPAGTFSCSSERINAIRRAILWSQRANLMGLPTDCPQRDERLGWIGDAHVTAEEAMYNFDMAQFYRKWLRDIQSTQSEKNGDLPYISPRPFTDGKGTPAWSSGYHLIVWYAYQYYGDRDLLAEHYDSMRRYVDHLTSIATDYILPMDEYGDWLSENADGWWQRGEPLSTSTGYYYYTADILARAAEILGHQQDALTYRRLAENIKKAWHAHFYHADSRLYENGSQFSNAFPLFLNIVPREMQESVLDSLISDIFQRKGHLSTGILGTKYMLEALSQYGRSDIAYLMVMQPDYPGWAHLLKEGHTTLSEQWNRTGSHNHVMFGSVDAWFYKVLAGIQPDPAAPGFEHILINPYVPAGLSWVKARHESIRGLVSSHWRVEGDQFTLEVSIPANCSATIHVPAKSVQSVQESGKPVQNRKEIIFERIENNHVVLRVGSGEYRFISAGISEVLDPVFVANPVITPADTFIQRPDKAVVRMESETRGAEIHYTLDGSRPTETSSRYTQPIVVEENAAIMARAFKPGSRPSFSSESHIHFVDPKTNGLRYQLYEGQWTALPDLSGLSPQATGIAFGFDPDKLPVPRFDFALAFDGFLAVEQSGWYTFYTKSNDGSRLYIDGKMVVDNDLEHLVQEKSGKLFLTAGRHPLRAVYFQSGGARALQVLYEGPGINKTVLSPVKLFQHQTD